VMMSKPKYVKAFVTSKRTKVKNAVGFFNI